MQDRAISLMCVPVIARKSSSKRGRLHHLFLIDHCSVYTYEEKVLIKENEYYYPIATTTPLIFSIVQF